LWALGQEGGKQKLWLSTADQDIEDPKIEEVAAPVLDKGRVTAFRISPDGTRMVLVRETRNGDELGLARIIRGDRITVDGWRRVNVAQTGGTQITQIADVAWLDATELLLLGAANSDAAMAPVRVTADGSRVSAEGDKPANWNAEQLTVLFRPQTTVVVGADGRTWRDEGSQWLPFLEGIDAIAYPG
jgi:hypothetical protein